MNVFRLTFWALSVGVLLGLASRTVAQSSVPIDVAVAATVNPFIDYTPDSPQGYVRFSGTFLPATPTGDGFRSQDSWGTAGDSLTAKISGVLVQPGQVYDVSIEGDNLYGNPVFTINAPQGYQVVLDGKPRPVESISWYGSAHVLMELVPRSQDPMLAGYASTVAMNRIDWRLPLGSLLNGDSAGSIGLIDSGVANNWSPLYAPGRLYYESTSNDVWTYFTNGVLRQVVAKQIAVDVVVVDSTSYELRCYNPAQIVDDSVTPREFSGQPFVTYRIARGTPQSNDSTAVAIKFTKEVRNVTDATSNPTITRREFMTLERTGAWPNFRWVKEDWYHEGETAVAETVVQSASATNGRTESIQVRPPGTSTPAISLSRSYQTLSGLGEMFCGETAGTSNTGPTNLAYDDDGFAWTLCRGVIKSAQFPDGRWVAFKWGNDRSQVTQEFRPYLNSPATPTRDPAQGEVTTYTYGADVYGLMTRVTQITTRVNGVTTASKNLWYTDYANGPGPWPWCTVTESRVQTGTSILSTFTHAWRDDYSDATLRGKIVSITYPDGTKVGFRHQSWGSTYMISRVNGYQPATVPPFTPWERVDNSEVVYLVVGKSTKDVTTRDSRGLVVREEKFVCTGSDSWGGIWQSANWKTYTYNYLGLLADTLSSNGSRYHAEYDGFLKTSETDESGVTTTYTYDAGGRVHTAIRAAYGAISSLTTTYVYDALGHILTTTVGPDSGEHIASTSTYDDAGRIATVTPPGGYGSVTHSYDPSNRSHTAATAGAGTVTTTTYVDGRTYSVTGTGTISKYHSYGIESDGRAWERIDIGSPVSLRWTKSWTDIAGNAVHTEQPGFNGSANLAADDSYDYVPGHYSTGHLYRSTQAGPGGTPLVKRLDYDLLGQAYRTGADLDDNGLVLASNDRVSDTNVALELYNGAYWWRTDTYTYPQPNSNTIVRTGFKRQRLTGFASGVIDEVQTGDADGNVTIRKTTLDPTTATTTVTTTTTGVTNAKVETYRAGLLTTVTTPDGLTTSTSYDSLLRPSVITDSRGNTTTTGYISGTSLVQTVTQNVTATTTAVSTTHYDTAGRKDWVENADSKRTYFAYNSRDQMVRQWGPASYPVEYAYNSYGEKIAMRTFRNPTQDFATSNWPLTDDTDPLNPDSATWTSGDKTTWTFDAGTGLLSSKTDALGRSVTYTYNPTKQLATREWARTIQSGVNAGQHVRTTYSYDAATGDQTSISYNDGTPTVSYTYTRLVQPDTVTDGATGIHDFVYDSTYPHRLSCEAFDTFYGQRVMTRLYDTTSVLGRPRGYQLGDAVGSNSDLEQSYGFATDSGRFSSVATTTTGISTTARTFHYGYETSSPLLKTLWTDDNNFFVSRTFDPYRDILTSVDSKWGQSATTSLTKYAYHSNALGQRDSVVQSGDAFAAYAGSDHAIHQTFSYSDRSEVTAAPTYTGGTVTDTTNPISNRQHEFSYDAIGNRNWTGVTGNNADHKAYTNNAANQIASRDNTLVPFSGTQSFVYDADGNITDDGQWTYTWDGENRLTTMVATTAAVIAGQPNLWIDFKYDYLGRRVEKKVTNMTSNTVTTWRRYIYDGWSLVAEYSVSGPSSLVLSRSYGWGLDIARSLTDAGGVGALLQIADHASGKRFLPTYDGNGNIASLVNANTGSIAAVYEYSPFGETIRADVNDSSIADQPFRFSTKYQDSETGNYYYGYRYYQPSIGRFIGRDPTEEKGGLHLFAFCRNNPINGWDVLGNLPKGTESYWDPASYNRAPVEGAGPAVTYFQIDPLNYQNPDLDGHDSTLDGYGIDPGETYADSDDKWDSYQRWEDGMRQIAATQNPTSTSASNASSSPNLSLLAISTPGALSNFLEPSADQPSDLGALSLVDVGQKQAIAAQIAIGKFFGSLDSKSSSMDQNAVKRDAVNIMALALAGTAGYSFNDFNSKQYPANSNKCSAFVGDVLTRVGLSANAHVRGRPSPGYLTAGEWAFTSNKNLNGWQVLAPGDSPQPGDIFAWKLTGGGTAYTGHTGIVVSDGQDGITFMAAHAGGVYSDAGQLASAPPSGAVYRRYRGSRR